MIDEILALLKALGGPAKRVQNVLKNRDAVPTMAGATMLVGLQKISTQLGKLTGEFLESLDVTPSLPGIPASEEDGAA